MTGAEFGWLANGVLLGWLSGCVVLLVGLVAYERWGR